MTEPENNINQGEDVIKSAYPIYTLVILGVIIIAGILALFFWESKKPIDEENVVDEQEIVTNPFEDISLGAKSVYVLDAETGEVLYEKNAEAQLPLASLTKTIVALTANNVVPEYSLVKITSNDLREQGDTGLLRDEEWSIKNLIDFALVVSSNDAVSAIAGIAGRELVKTSTSSPEEMFVSKMNEFAQTIGMSETYFLNGSGLDLSGAVSGAYGSARDMATLFKYILKTNPDLLEATTFEEIDIASKHKVHNAVNTNKALGSIPSVLASKTGYTELSGGNLVVAFDAGVMKPVIIAVLGSTYEGRFEDMKKLVQATLEL